MAAIQRQTNVLEYRNNQADTKKKPAAKCWLNIGQMGTEIDEHGNVLPKFIPLVSGIALDTMDDAKGRSQFSLDRNALRDGILADIAANLEPGEGYILEGDCGGLVMELRRVKDEEAFDQAKSALDPNKRTLFGKKD